MVPQDRNLERAFEDAVSLHEAGRLPEAERAYQAILQTEPDHFGSLHHLGVLRGQQGKLVEAITLLGLALTRKPDSAEAQNHAGAILLAMKRHQEAIACLDKALALDPGYAEAYYNRGAALQALGQHQNAIASYEAALALEPDIPAAHYNLGAALQALNRHEDALAHYQKAIRLAPGYARAHVALSSSLQALRRYEEAIAHCEAALAIDPNLADAHNHLGLALQALNRHREAVAHHERALSLNPDLAAARNNLGAALQALNRHDEAIAQYREAIARSPPSALRYANLGLALQEIGRFDEACRAFEKAIELAPRTGRFYRNLADCKRFTAADPLIGAMERLARDKSPLPEEGRRQLLFALGKAFADLGEHERSLGWLIEGNALKRQQIGYDEAKVLGQFERIQQVFNRELVARGLGLGHPSSVPVFILGMPRSGTSLVEQILASHPRVFGAGELSDFEAEVAGLRESDGAPGSFPDVVARLSGEQLRKLGARYLERITPSAPDAERITDKMPLNFLFAGLIHLALPSARIIHTIRDPVDTCLSCFMTLFTGEHRVAYELGELGRYYRAYARLMDHWRNVLPSRAMLEVRYEDVVADLDREARRIVAYCGLEWDDACLSYYRTRRPVRTASVVQVRQPIYRSSIGRWRAYGTLLRPLLDALGDLAGNSAAN